MFPQQDTRVVEDDVIGEADSFGIFGLKSIVVQSLQLKNFIKPTPIQETAIPIALNGIDIVARAKNGTGKTGAYTIPILNAINPTVQDIQAVILTNTRELAMQVSQVVQGLGSLVPGIGNRVMCLVGGEEYKNDIERIQRHPSVLVATVGKLKDFLQQGLLNLRSVKIFVIDEADNVIFQDESQEQIDYIIKSMKRDCQKMLFSATFQPKIQEFTEKYLAKDMETINCMRERLTCKGITQYVAHVKDESMKMKLIGVLLLKLKMNQAIIFVNSVGKAEQIQYNLNENLKIPSCFVHGQLTQEERSRIFHDFQQKRARVLVATDLYSRGIDIRTVNIVINYDVPRSGDEYLHRIGRCGRFGHRGIAVTIYCRDSDKVRLLDIDEALQSPMQVLPRRIEDIPEDQYIIRNGEVM